MEIQEIIQKTKPSSEEAIFLIQEYLTDIKREDIQFAKFISTPDAGHIFEQVKIQLMNVNNVMNNPSIMFSTINDFFSYCYNIALKHFKEKLDVNTFRVFDKNGTFLFQY